MSSSAKQLPMTVAERLSHIADQDAVPPTARIAVIDIGSNSVRLVIYGKNGAYLHRYLTSDQIAGLVRGLMKQACLPMTVLRLLLKP